MEVLSRTPPKADFHLPYGSSKDQFGDLWLPAGAREAVPIVVFLHGGWWKAEYDIDHFDIIDPETPAWIASREAILKLLHG